MRIQWLPAWWRCHCWIWSTCVIIAYSYLSWEFIKLILFSYQNFNWSYFRCDCPTFIQRLHAWATVGRCPVGCAMLAHLQRVHANSAGDHNKVDIGPRYCVSHLCETITRRNMSSHQIFAFNQQNNNRRNFDWHDFQHLMPCLATASESTGCSASHFKPPHLSQRVFQVDLLLLQSAALALVNQRTDSIAPPHNAFDGVEDEWKSTDG